MKNIEIDEELYQYIASNTQFIGESASSILRRLLSLEGTPKAAAPANETSVAHVQEQPTENAQNQVEAKAETQTKKAAPDVSIADDEKTEQKTEQVTPQPAGINGNETVFNYINKEELGMQRGAVGRFLLILAALYRVHPQQFSLVREIRGRDRLYFSDNESDLNASGSSTKPRQIPDSPYWVITNSNTTRKKMMLTEVAVSLGYGESDAEKIRELL